MQYQKRQSELVEEARASIASGVELNALEPKLQKALVPPLYLSIHAMVL